MPPAEDVARFESVEWDRIERSRRMFTSERLTLLGGLLILGVMFLYDQEIAHVYFVWDWRIELLDWLFLVSLLLLTAYAVVPALKRRKAVRRTFGSLRRKPLVLVAIGYLGLIGFLGLFGPVLGWGPSLRLEYTYNPPIGFTSEHHRNCLGATSGDPFNEICHGALSQPLGTNRQGMRMEQLLVAGARPALYVIVIGAVLVVPIATTVGVLAGMHGGLADKILMSYVDLQLSIPAILIYVFAYMWWGASLLILLLAFGLLSWGGIARLVRSEVIQRREDGHVTIARSLGASKYYLATRHILPNITNTLIPAICHLLALFVLYEAGIAFLGFYEADLFSWGRTISESVNAAVAGQQHERASEIAYEIWWISTFPAIALTLTMVSFKVLGDGLRDALDPRGEH